MNVVMLTGRTTSAIVVEYLPSGDAVINFSLATDESYRNKGGDKVDQVEFHNMVAYGKLAEVIAEHFPKGFPITITRGKLKTRRYEHKEFKIQISRTEIIIEDFEFPLRPPKVEREISDVDSAMSNKALPPPQNAAYSRGSPP